MTAVANGADREDLFAQLLATPGVREHVELRSSFGIMAYHGGSLEQMTDVIASEAAEAAGASYYGVTQPDDMRWHLPSTMVRPGSSAALRSFIEHVDVVVTVHGYGRHGMFTSLLLGGSNRRLAEHLGSHLRPALPGYEIVTDLDVIPPELRGLHSHNPVNLPPRGGVQIELPPRVRGTSPLSPPPGDDGLSPPTRALIDVLAAVASSWAGESDEPVRCSG